MTDMDDLSKTYYKLLVPRSTGITVFYLKQNKTCGFLYEPTHKNNRINILVDNFDVFVYNLLFCAFECFIYDI